MGIGDPLQTKSDMKYQLVLQWPGSSLKDYDEMTLSVRAVYREGAESHYTILWPEDLTDFAIA